MVFCIEKFSSSLCLAYAIDQDFYDLPIQCFHLTDESDDVEDVIYKFSMIYIKEFHPIVDELSNIKTFESFDSYVKANLARYVKLSKYPSYFSFLLLCSLVDTLLSEIFTFCECFTYAKVISLCLIAVYDRCYKDFFKVNEESESLGSFCKRLNPSLRIKDGISQLPVDIQEQFKSIFTSLEDVDYKNFSLTDFEQNMLRDIFNVVPTEGVHLKHEVTTSKSCESNSASADVTGVEQVVACLNLPGPEDDSTRANRICKTCDAKCFKFLASYKNEVLEKDIIEVLERISTND